MIGFFIKHHSVTIAVIDIIYQTVPTFLISVERPKPYIDPSPGQQAEFILACKGEGPQPLCHFGYSGPLTEANHLGNVAYRADQKLEWDAKNMKFPNAPEAEKFLGREHRDGWSLA